MKTVLFVDEKGEKTRVTKLKDLYSNDKWIYAQSFEYSVYSCNSEKECMELVMVLYRKLADPNYVSALVYKDIINFYKKIPGEMAVVRYKYDSIKKYWDTE